MVYRSFLKGVFVSTVLLCSWLAWVSAQPVVRIVGTVSDISGGVIPGAEVVATEVATSFRRTAVTDERGYYVLAGLRVGEYRIECELPGFKRFVQEGIRLEVDQTAELNIELQPGELTTIVQVTGNVSQLDTQTATLKEVVDERRVRELPLNGRDVTQLVLLVPGVVASTRDESGLRQGGSGRGIINPGVASNGARSNMVNYDLDGAFHNDTYVNVPMAMPNPDALQEFSVQTNNFDAEYGRSAGAVVNAITRSGTNDFHGSLFYFHRNEALNARNFFAQGGDGLKRHQFGGTIGGPILRDKTFFFFTYQETRNLQTPTDRSTVVLTEAQRAGDFSAYSGTLIDPLTGDPFPNNQIPIERLNYVTKNVFDQLLPLPTEPDTGLLWYSVPADTDLRQLVVKIDHEITPTSFLTGRYLYNYYKDPGNDVDLVFANRLKRTTPSHNFMVGHTHIFNPQLLNSANFSYNRRTDLGEPFWNLSFADLGVKNIYVDSPTNNFNLRVYGAFQMSITEWIKTQPVAYSFKDTVRWTTGAHSLSMGVEIRRQDLNKEYRWLLDPYIRFHGDYTGYGPADFFLGLCSMVTQKGAGELADQHFPGYAAFIQDSIRLRPNLTVTLGLRYDPFIPYTDDQIRLSAFRPGQRTTFFDNAPDGMLYGGEQGIPMPGTESDLDNFAPRIGIAWSPAPKTSVRAGYGIFYDSNLMSAITNVFQNVAPYGTRIDLRPTPGPFDDPYAGNNPFPMPFPPPKDIAFPEAGLSMASYPEKFQAPYLQSWNLTIEHQLFPNTLVRAAYAGSKGTHLLQGLNINGGVYIPGESSWDNLIDRRPYPSYSDIWIVDSTGNSSYNALQLSLDKRLAADFGILAHYTWSKSIDYGSGGGTLWPDYSNPFDLRHSRGLSDFQISHRFVASWLWNLPRLDSDSAAVRTVLHGWALNGAVTLQSGMPFSVFAGTGNSLTGVGTDRADIVGDPTRPAGVDPVRQWFNTDAFVENAEGTFGNSGRNILWGPGYANVDMAISKDFAVWRESIVQFRFEAFNLFNRTNLKLPSSNLTSGTYGRITSAFDPRILQFGLKFRF